MLALFNWEITSDLFVGTVSSVFSPNMFKKQDGMLVFFFVLCLRFSCPKLQKNKTECSHFSITSDLLLVLCRRFSPQICLKTGRNARPFQLGNNLRPIFWYCVVGFLPKYVKKQDGMLAFFFVLCLRCSCPKLQKTKRNAGLFLVLCPRFSHQKYCPKTKRNARLFHLGNNIRPIFWYCVVGFLPKDV